MAVLFVERVSLGSGKIDFPIQIAALSTVCFKASWVDFPNKCVPGIYHSKPCRY